MFQINVDNLGWIDNMENNCEDLCLHGHVVAYIGNKKLEYNATVSATALYLLKSLTEDHIIYEDNQMLPCCGFFLIADSTLENVTISGCPNGIDWSVIHKGEYIELILEDGPKTIVPIKEYQNTVFQFADKIEAFYQSSPTRILPSNKFDRNGYIAFWNEWHRRRNHI